MGPFYDGTLCYIGFCDVYGWCCIYVAFDPACGISLMIYFTTLFYIAIGCIVGYVAGTLITVWAYRDEIGGCELESRNKRE